MNNPFSFEAEQFDYPIPGKTQRFNEGTWEIGSPQTFDYEGGGVAVAPPPPLSAAALGRAVIVNRILARRLGWGCVAHGHVQSITDEHNQLRVLLHLPVAATEEDIARAVANFQRNEFHRPGDGQLGPGTWQRLLQLNVLQPTTRFAPGAWRVFARGGQIGVIEKTRAYSTHQDAASGGVQLEFGFRVIDIDAARRAGFVDGTGEPVFRWIQVFELRTVFGAADPTTFGFAANTEQLIQRLRRSGRGSLIDPTPPLLAGDVHPYYWDAGAEELAHTHQRGENGLCYDTIFSDRPNMPFVATQPGRRAYYNFETALVGVAPPHRNVILNTLIWGFDLIRLPGAGGVRLGINPLRAGPTGGSRMMRHVLSREITGPPPHFPGHCFVGGGFGRAATCT